MCEKLVKYPLNFVTLSSITPVKFHAKGKTNLFPSGRIGDKRV